MIAHQTSIVTERTRKIAAQHCFDVRRHIIKWLKRSTPTSTRKEPSNMAQNSWQTKQTQRWFALPSKKEDIIPMRNVNGFRQQGDRPEMHKKDYQRCRCAETVEITLTTVSSARIRRYHAPEILCLQQNIGASIRGPNYFLNTHTLVSGRAHDTTWDKDKKLLRWSEQEQNWF